MAEAARDMGIQVKVSGPEAGAAVSGLAVFQFECQRVTRGGELRVLSDAAQVIHSRPLSEPASFWLAVNTHLLGDGSRRVRFEIGGRDQPSLWTHEALLEIRNGAVLADSMRRSMHRHTTPAVFDQYIQSSQFDYADRELVPWFDRPDAMQVLQCKRASGEVAAHEVASLEQFVRDGYAILDYRLGDGVLAELNAALDWVIESGYQAYKYGSSQRIEQLHRHKEAVASLWRDPNILSFLEKIFESPALPCQTLTYIFGSQQDFHQDTIHLTPFPAGYMCGVWVALEDVREDSGELAIIPGSHRFPRVYRESVGCAAVRNGDWTEFGDKVVKRWGAMLNESGLGEIKYRPQRGSVLVWHENLMHGGSMRRNPGLSRRSIVSHYFAQGALAYYDSSAMPGYMFA